MITSQVFIPYLPPSMLSLILSYLVMLCELRSRYFVFKCLLETTSSVCCSVVIIHCYLSDTGERQWCTTHSNTSQSVVTGGIIACVWSWSWLIWCSWPHSCWHCQVLLPFFVFWAEAISALLIACPLQIGLTSIESSFRPCKFTTIVPGAYPGEAKMCKKIAKMANLRVELLGNGWR